MRKRGAFRILCARLRMEAMMCGERMCGLKDLKTFLFPPRVKGEKKMHLGSQSKFLVSVPIFWSSAATFEGLPLWKKRNKREREKEDMRREL